MKVTNIRPAAPRTTQKTKRGGQAEGLSFSDHLAKTGGGAASDGTVQEAASVSAATSILAVQEVGGDGENEKSARRQLARRGEDILDRLDEIRRDILLGAVPRHKLETLAQLLQARRAGVTDPELLAVIDEIELRAAVEIAKLSRTG